MGYESLTLLETRFHGFGDIRKLLSEQIQLLMGLAFPFPFAPFQRFA
jgi:hypothetical protein